MTELRRRFLDAAEAALAVVAAPEVGRRWAEASVLTAYDVGSLAAHTGRALITLDTYLAASPPDPGADVVDAAGYYALVLGDHDPVDGDLHRTVRARSAAAAADGQQALVTTVAETLERLRETDLDADRPVAVLDGVVVALGDYLMTRLVELVVHADDLSASVGLPSPEHPAEVWDLLAGLLQQVARGRAGARQVALALARPERHGPLGAFG